MTIRYNRMHTLASVVFFFLSILLVCIGLYVGIWVMLIGGIVDIINQIKAPETNSVIVARSVTNIVLFEMPIVIGIGIGVFFGRASVHFYRK